MTRKEQLQHMEEKFQGDFWRAVESLIAHGWRMNDFRDAGIEEIFNESFDNPVSENMDYIAGLMPEKAVKDEDYLIVH